MDRKFRVVPIRPIVSATTVEYLEKRLAEARKGDLVGIACVAIYKTTFVPNAIGRATENPLVTRSMVLCLDDVLREIQYHAPPPT